MLNYDSEGFAIGPNVQVIFWDQNWWSVSETKNDSRFMAKFDDKEKAIEFVEKLQEKGQVHQLDIFDKNNKFVSSRVREIIRPPNIQHEILIETYRPWVKKLGQWHLSNDDGQTRCGVPMLGNNYANEIPEEQRTKCEKCFR